MRNGGQLNLSLETAYSHLVPDVVSHDFAIEEHVGIDSPVVAFGSSQLFPVQVREVQQHL